MAITFLSLPNNMHNIISFESQPVTEYQEQGRWFCEVVDDEKDASFWSVYYRVDSSKTNDNPVHCCADCTDKETALELEGLLSRMLNLMAPPDQITAQEKL
ncbi:hypothetical protein PV783_34020 [Chitinophaga sp. CC14]|uniref:hypothetical protein n=1 Tax=Chitinophaga sp. CC14 TaxID=3029199 RepID=UPI003B7759F0